MVWPNIDLTLVLGSLVEEPSAISDQHSTPWPSMDEGQDSERSTAIISFDSEEIELNEKEK